LSAKRGDIAERPGKDSEKTRSPNGRTPNRGAGTRKRRLTDLQRHDCGSKEGFDKRENKGGRTSINPNERSKVTATLSFKREWPRTVQSVKYQP